MTTEALEQQPEPPSILSVFAKVLLLRAKPEELKLLGVKHFCAGLFCTWLVGVGRYWDNPRVELLQHLGLGSVVYVFVLSAFIWLLLFPVKPKNWNYFRLLTYITLTSPPAVLYAIPVEMVAGIDTALLTNLAFLWIVASWRVVLLIRYLRIVAEFKGGTLFVAAFAPITVILLTLTVLNLEKVVFDFMGGFHHRPGQHDVAYQSLVTVTFISQLSTIPVAIGYAYLSLSNYGEMLIKHWRVCISIIVAGAIAFFVLSPRPSLVADDLERAEHAMWNDRDEEAFAIAQECIEKDPKEGEGYVVRAQAEERLGRLADALKDYRKAASLNHRVDYALIKESELCLTTGAYSKVEPALESNRQRILSFIPQERLQARTCLKYAAIRLLQGNRHGALTMLNTAVREAELMRGYPSLEKDKPKSNWPYEEDLLLADALEARGTFFLLDGQLEKSKGDLEGSLRYDPDQSDTRLLLATVLKRLGDSNSMLSLGKQKNDVTGKFIQARIYSGQGKFTESVVAYVSCIDQVLALEAREDTFKSTPNATGELALILEGCLTAERAGQPQVCSSILEKGIQIFSLRARDSEKKFLALLARAVLYDKAKLFRQRDEDLSYLKARGYEGPFPPVSSYVPIEERSRQESILDQTIVCSRAIWLAPATPN